LPDSRGPGAGTGEVEDSILGQRGGRRSLTHRCSLSVRAVLLPCAARASRGNVDGQARAAPAGCRHDQRRALAAAPVPAAAPRTWRGLPGGKAAAGQATHLHARGHTIAAVWLRSCRCSASGSIGHAHDLCHVNTRGRARARTSVHACTYSPAQRPVSPSEAGLIGVGMACTTGSTCSAKRRRLCSALCRGMPP
jgi:hypothetical protein